MASSVPSFSALGARRPVVGHYRRRMERILSGTNLKARLADFDQAGGGLDPLALGPLLQRLTLLQGAQLALPDAAQHHDAHVGAAEVLDGPIRNRALADLGRVVLHV